MLTGWVSEEENNKSNWVRSLGLFSVILTDLIGYTGAGIGIGYLAWTKLGAPWWVLMLTTLLGLSISMVRLYQLSKREL